MIIIRYLVRETLKSQLAILFILLLIFFCQKLVRILGAAVDGEVPTNLVLTLLGLGVPEMAQLILPLSLFLAILMTLGRLYTESEITVMHACGLSKAVLVKAAMVLMLFTSVVAAVNVIWLGPGRRAIRNRSHKMPRPTLVLPHWLRDSSRRPAMAAPCCSLRTSRAISLVTSSWRSYGRKAMPDLLWCWRTAGTWNKRKTVHRL